MTTRKLLQRHWALLPMGVLALVLLLNQTVGLMHGIVHGPSIIAGPAAQVAQASHAAALVAEPDHDADAFMTSLFSGHNSHGGEVDCRLYDQSSHCDAMPGVPLLALPLVQQPFVFSVLPGLAVARWHALFQARGPPSVR